MANSNIAGTQRTADGKVIPSAALAREQYRRNRGEQADSSYDEAFSYFGHDDSTDPNLILRAAARLVDAPVYEAPDVGDLMTETVSEITSGDNPYYDKADEMTAPVYESRYDTEINSLVDRILGGEDFGYDAEGDALYQQYSRIYERNARQSAENSMAQAQAASGGYANSYAQAAAQQAYNAEMQELGEALPEFEAQAYERYADERADRYDTLSALMSAEESDYEKYRDSVSDFYADREYLTDMGDRYSDNLYNSAELLQSLEEFYFDKEKYADDVEYKKATAAAETGDYSLLGEWLGIDTSEAEKWYSINRAAELFDTTEMLVWFDELGIDTSEIRAQMANEKFAEQLNLACTVYSETGDASMLNALGIDTDYQDEMLVYLLAQAKGKAEQ